MLIRVIDYVASRGGGVRFTGEVVKALLTARQDAFIEVISFGEGLDAYRNYLDGVDGRVRVSEVRPRQSWRNTTDRLFGIPGSRSVMQLLGVAHRWKYDIPDQLQYGCDVVWIPWGNRHALPHAWE